MLLADSGQTINAVAEIHGFYCHQNAHLWRNLNHIDSHKPRLSPARSGALDPFHWIRIFPCGPSNSIRHSAVSIACGPTSSTNADGGGAVLSVLPKSVSRFSFAIF